MRSVPDSDAVMAQCAGEEGRSLSDLLASYPGHEEHVTRVWLAAHADRVPSEPFASADRSGPYERLRLVGRGAQGEVFLARDVRTQRRVALKILSGSPGPHAIARLRHEARAIARLRHPGIAELLDADLDSESPWLALRYVEGTALRDARTDPVCPVALFALPGQPLPNGFLRWFEQLARAVHVAQGPAWCMLTFIQAT
ncbi:MAG: protein kinase [Proteobacteria bacterium]|nr:protein kinase [Pseudomonadota bacterium]